MTNPSTDLTVTKQTTELTIGSGAGLEHAYRVAKALAQSGFFKDAQQPAQAMAKIVAGVEYGIGAFAAMTQIHAIDGKLSPGATLVAALIQRSGRYRFRQVQSTDQVCTLEFFFRDEDGSWVSNGEVSFTIDEAKAAGLVGKNNWRGYPADMLFARALGRGARRFCADVFGGASTYTPDELGAVTNQSGDLDDAAIDADAVEAIIADVDTPADDTTDLVIETAEFEDVPDDDPLGGGDSVRIRIPVTGSTGKQYEIIVYHAGDWDCSCQARTQECRHVKEVRRPFPGGSGWLWPGDVGYEDAPPAGGQVVVDATGDVEPSGTSGLLAYARDLGLKDTDAMLVIAQAGGPDNDLACREALHAFADKRDAAADEAGEAA